MGSNILDDSCKTSHLVVRLEFLICRAFLFGISDNWSVKVFQYIPRVLLGVLKSAVLCCVAVVQSCSLLDVKSEFIDSLNVSLMNTMPLGTRLISNLLWEYAIEEVECANHAIKGFRTHLENIVQSQLQDKRETH